MPHRVAIAALTMLPLCGLAWAHGALNLGALNPESDLWAWHLPAATAGKGACAELAAAEVKILPHGFLIGALDEFVPQHETRPSGDGHFWYCGSGGRGHPLLVPPGVY